MKYLLMQRMKREQMKMTEMFEIENNATNEKEMCDTNERKNEKIKGGASLLNSFLKMNAKINCE